MAKKINPFWWVLGGAAVLGAGIATAAAAAAAPAAPAAPVPAGDGPARPPSPQPDSGSEAIQIGTDTSEDQTRIIAAFWTCVSQGDDAAVRLLQTKLAALTPELQVYVVAAGQSAVDSYRNFLKWQEAFPHELEAANQQADEINTKLNAGLGTIAAAVNVVPVAGQVLSAVLGLGIALKKAFAEGHVERNPDENLQLFRDWEGSDCLRGLHLGGVNPNDVTPQKLRSRIDADLIASRLPSVSFGHQFDYTPTIESFRTIAKSRGLYSNSYLKSIYGFENAYSIVGDDDIPTTAYDINNYVIGYAYGQQSGGEPFSSNVPWVNIGHQDAQAGKASRVGNDLAVWADHFVNGE